MRHTALIASDDSIILHKVEDLLNKAGFELFTAQSSQEAVSMVGDISPTIIVLSSELSPLDGWRTCREIRKFSDTPIIMMGNTYPTGSSRDWRLSHAWHTAVEVGADLYLPNHCSGLEFLARVRALLRRQAHDKRYPRPQGQGKPPPRVTGPPMAEVP